ncbi:RNA polymerase, sigma 70 subunit, RpoD [human gut metagenome]|uniref:RNA polymerase, sigma 70 subunit, RpoD n=1 Tax=human gut metagenome TaxID=408170 RepID=K1V1K1_9ZZZZ
MADDASETSADETISETASVSNHVESEEELSFIKMYMEEMEALPNLSKDEEADLIDKLLAGDTSVSSKIVEANLSLVAKIAESHRGKGVNFGDLIQEGNVGLMLAVSDYTESVGDFHSFILICGFPRCP